MQAGPDVAFKDDLRLRAAADGHAHLAIPSRESAANDGDRIR